MKNPPRPKAQRMLAQPLDAIKAGGMAPILCRVFYGEPVSTSPENALVPVVIRLERQVRPRPNRL
jgi:hypothetical protein